MERFESSRLRLRPLSWQDEINVQKLNQDREVMKFFPATLTESETKQYIEKSISHFSVYGYGNYCVEEKETGNFVGVIGLLTINFEHELNGEIEIGWRFAKQYWHQGYATESARVLIDYARSILAIPKIYSFTATINYPSEQVMKRLDMEYIGTFSHPKVARTSELNQHVLYCKHLIH